MKQFNSKKEILNFITKTHPEFSNNQKLIEGIYEGFKDEIEKHELSIEEVVWLQKRQEEYKSILSWNNFDLLVEILKIDNDGKH